MKVVGSLEEMGWLDSAEQAITQAIDPVVRTAEESGIMDWLHGRWLGHALHPVLSDVPLGFWSAAALLDLLNMEKPAAVMSASGSLAAVGTAVTGIADWSVTQGRDRRLGLLHGLLNTAGLVVQLGSLTARLRGRPKTGRSLGMLGWTVGLAAAYFGGELVFGRGLMVDHNAWSGGPQQWTGVGATNDLSDGQTRQVEVEGRPILLYREQGELYALENTCSHAGGPLAKGEVRDGIVTCPWHGSQFRLTDGSIRRGPATFPQLRLETRVRAGQVEVRGRQS